MLKTSILRAGLGALALLFVATSWAAGGHGHGGGAQGPITDTRELTKDEATIQAVLDKYAKAMEQKSVELMEQAVIPGDFSTIESGYPNWTWEDFRDNHLSKELEVFKDIDYTIELLLGEIQGDIGFAIYKYTAAGKLIGKDGKPDIPMSVSGLATAILEKTDLKGTV